MDRHTQPPSPCNNTCIVDRRNNRCVGCLRTLDEIAAWGTMSPEEQWDVIDALAQRRAKENDGTRSG
jgi:predicted Fe-S protein YdhL (DUF1289 family)